MVLVMMTSLILLIGMKPTYRETSELIVKFEKVTMEFSGEISFSALKDYVEEEELQNVMLCGKATPEGDAITVTATKVLNQYPSDYYEIISK